MSKIVNKVILLIITITMVFGIFTISNAEEAKTPTEVEKVFGNTRDNMPQNNIQGSTGMMPQYYSSGTYRKVTFPDTRLNLETNQWEATIDGEIVYCARRGAYVRYGVYDSEEHLFVPGIGNMKMQGVSLNLTSTATLENALEQHMNQPDGVLDQNRDFVKDNGIKYWKDGELVPAEDSVYYTVTSYGGLTANALGVIPVGETLAEMSENKSILAIDEMTNHMEDIMEQLGRHVWPGHYSYDINGQYTEWDITETNGPKIVVLENIDKESNGYKKTGTGTYKNDIKAYILTALENAYSYETGECAQEYTLNDIQTAYWFALNHENKEYVKPTTNFTDKGKELFEDALEYAKFMDDINKNGYNTSINSKDAKVIADRNKQYYYVGPFSITYPQQEDISYIKALTVETSGTNKRTLTYGLDKNEFEIIPCGEITKSNGIKQVFPGSGQQFFIKVSSNSIKDATQIKLGTYFEYIDGTTINYDMLTTEAHIYQYIGYSGIILPGISTSPYKAKQGTIKVDVYCLQAEDAREEISSHDGEYHRINRVSVYKDDYSCCNGGVKVENTNNENKEPINIGSASLTAYQPFIKMSDTYETATAQDLLVGNEGKRIYKTDYIETDYIDITMELGGYVWVDEKSGKLDERDGLKNSNEKVVPGVTVILRKFDKVKDLSKDELPPEVDRTVTDEDGKYRFTKLNAMDVYCVQFIYNGQYYEPVNYVSPLDETNGWGKGNWKNNSNATDKMLERVNLNAIFESIGSYPHNYSVQDGNTTIYRKTFTKNELIEAGIINEFGNLIKTESTDVTEKAMITYVKDCQMNAYTGKDNLITNRFDYDYYPVPNIFNISDIPVLDRHKTLLGLGIERLYPAAYYINLGLQAREEADLAVKKDISKVTLEINGSKHEYTYNTRDNANDPNNNGDWEISVRLSDGYYNTEYTRELYKSDYLYKVSDYGDQAQALGKTSKDELEVYVTYKVMVRNQSMAIRTRVDELVDYYDKDYDYVDERSYIQITRYKDSGFVTEKYKTNYKPSKYLPQTATNLDGYDKLYIAGLGKQAIKLDQAGNEIETVENGIYLEPGETAYVYLTYKVKKDANRRIILDEDILDENKKIGVGKENIVEINGYSTQYTKGTTIPNVFELDENGNERLKDVGGTPAGLVDKDSTPGNLDPVDVPKDGTIKYENFEDDTDKAPNIRIKLYRDDSANRVISGNVWEDTRNKEINVTAIGNGIKDNNETLINGVTVQLVEIMENGKEFVWREFGSDITGQNSIGQGTGTGSKASEKPIINGFNLVSDYTFGENHNGQYAFKSFIPGKYVVRFIYGDTIKTVAPGSLGGLNDKSYNGQDYKSTTYQNGIVQNNSYEWRKASTYKNGQETLGDMLTIVSTFKNDASNNETVDLSKKQNDAWFNNRYGYLYDALASEKVKGVSDAKDIESRRNEVTAYSDKNVTNYIAEVLAAHKSDYTTMNDRNTLLNDLMQNTKMRAETGLMVIEFEKGVAESNGTNTNKSYVIDEVDLGLVERPKAQVIMNKEVTNVKLTLADGSILFDASNTAPNVSWNKHEEYENGYKGNLMKSSIENIRKEDASESIKYFGSIVLMMDEELMHGATIKISYKMTVTNVGEVDYIDNLYYYTGKISPNAKVVTTRVDKVLDYVANNLQFYAKDNINWKVISTEEIKNQGLVNSKLNNEIVKYNSIIVSDDFAVDLVPKLYKDKVNKNAKDSVSVPLVLTQLITTENNGDDLTYTNIAEIVEISNTAGRRQEYSVVGNQNPAEEPQEVDTDKAEVVKILPPFGSVGIYVMIAVIVIAAASIFVLGTLFIKKKVLNK